MSDQDRAQELRRAAERKVAPKVGAHGELAGVVNDLPSWTPEELQAAEDALRAVWQQELEHALHTARHGRLGLPRSKGPGYFAARAYLLECLLHPVRWITGTAPDQAMLEQLTPGGQVWQVPEREDTAQRELEALQGRIRSLQHDLHTGAALGSWTKLQRQAIALQLQSLLTPRCHVCYCHQPADHVPGSEACHAAKLERERSQSADD